MAQSSSSASRVAALTGARGLAAASVVVFHVWDYGAVDGNRFTAGPALRVFANLDIGVTFFFVLSGLLLYRPYARALLAGREWPTLRNFAIARFLRIVPVYWAAVIATAALTQRWLFDHPWRLVANLFFAEFAIPRFATHNLGVDNGSIVLVPSWSLVVEAGFYVVLPIAVAVALRAGRPDRRPFATALLTPALLFTLAAAATIAEHTISPNTLGDWNATFPIHAAQFGSGMLAATFWARWERRRPTFPAWAGPVAVLGALGLVALSFKLHNQGWLTDADEGTVAAPAFALLLLLVVLSPSGGRVHRTLGARIFVLMGLASYSVFLVHDPLIRVLRAHVPMDTTPVGLMAMLALVGAATVVAAFVSYRLLEKPCLALKQRYTATPSPAPSAARVATAPAPNRPAAVAVTSAVASIVAHVDRGRAPEFSVTAAPDVQVDLQSLQTVLAPLLRNALDYGAPPFVVRARTVDDNLHVEVEDHGRGIARSFAPFLFEPGMRSAASRSVPGAGMGLAEARESARQLGGDIVHRPSRHGAHFTITLPFSPELAPATRPPSLPQPLHPAPTPAAGWQPSAFSSTGR